MLAILSLLSIGLQTKHIASGVCLGNGQANEFFARQNIGDDPRLEVRIAEVKNGRETNDFSAQKTVAIPTITTADEFLSDDQLMEVVELERCG
jgi:hypothetical protein